MNSLPSSSTIRQPLPERMNLGGRSTALNALTGEFTPPGMNCTASRKSFSETSLALIVLTLLLQILGDLIVEVSHALLLQLPLAEDDLVVLYVCRVSHSTYYVQAALCGLGMDHGKQGPTLFLERGALVTVCHFAERGKPAPYFLHPVRFNV